MLSDASLTHVNLPEFSTATATSSDSFLLTGEAQRAQAHRLLRYLDLAFCQLRRAEDELHHFLESYYQQVGKLCELLAEEQQIITNPCFPSFRESTFPHPSSLPHEAGKNEANPSISQRFFRETLTIFATETTEGKPASSENPSQAKALYRALARRIHPDATHQLPEETASQWMTRLNEAYAKGEFSLLKRVEMELFQLEMQKILSEGDESALSIHCQRITAAIIHLRQRYRQLIQSPAYLLMRKVFKARLEGVDLIANIRITLERQLKHLRYRQACERLSRLSFRQKSRQITTPA
jgi:hypothetical protein